MTESEECTHDAFTLRITGAPPGVCPDCLLGMSYSRRPTHPGQKGTSPKPNRSLECDNKTRYPSRRSALRGKRFLKEKGEDVHPYQCNACSGWHVGHRYT